MNIYRHDNQIKLVHTIASMSTLISSLTAECKNYILKKFPKNFKKHVYVDTALVSNMVNTNKKYNQSLNKVEYPSITISPEISLDNPINGMDTNPHESNPNIFLKKDLNNSYFKIFVDPEKKMSLYYTCDYVTVNFNVKIATKTFIQNSEVVYYLKTAFYANKYRYLNDCYMNTEIPKTFISIIAELLGYDLNNPIDMDNLRLYLLSVSKREGVIHKKINTATGKPCFFMNDPSNILLYLDNIDAPVSIIRENQAEGEYIINFRLQASTYLANNFILAIDQDKFKRIYDDVQLRESLFDETIVEQDDGIYSLGIRKPFILDREEAIYFKDVNGQTHIGQNIVHEVLTYDINKRDRTINIKPFLKNDLLKVHSYMIAKHLDVSSLLHVKCTVDDEDYHGINNDSKKLIVDLDNLQIDLKNIESDVGINIYVDRSTFDAIFTAKEKDLYIFDDSFLTTMNVGFIDEDGNNVYKKAVVKAFKNEKEFASDDISKQLRVNTIYGVGYFYLVKEDDPLASDLKICLGEDKFGNKIIRAFVLIEE